MKKGIFIGLLVFAVGLSAARGAEDKPLKIRWFGQSCFLVTWPNGTSILIDPFSPQLGYDMPSPKPDAVLISHEHFDHNYAEMAKGEPQVIRGLKEDGEWNQVSTFIKGIAVRSVGTFHDDRMGILRGKITIFFMEGQGYRVAHLGDLGHELGELPVQEIGTVDVLLVPVGGTLTIDAKGADKVVEKLEPKVIIPMHYKTDKINMPIAPVDPFLAGKLGVNRLKKNHIELYGLPETPVIYVMDYK